ncbi:sigma-70 family RNA polymerase sigma factor [Kitasatospora kifunensis]|uniref:Transcriptional regulator with XRE-family HTH domain n=1 Tax=Kitasatospora kifunensis TaxID=58351 RepID=A0A7W7RBQ1_KITKI|nr:sigma-70 family RNA polymerase sigma factor [Kitasatospora kifunensis]MBB4929028.1 transcriptional regulator with XRE-family HTH domain [Kitasatospora kifunensis]
MQEILRTKVMTADELGAALSLSKGRVSQIKSGKSGPPVHRAFLGAGALIVALGGKVENRPKQDPLVAPVVAAEDFRTYERLRDLAGQLQLDADYEVIPPPGNVNLNRDDLVVICGPRLSPLIEQILESDRNLRFDKDEGGWHLEDRSDPDATVEHRSPMDASGESADVAYFARLPRPDGRGTFLYVAGIHAIGSAGVIHWLESGMAEAYQTLKTRRFSVLIRSTFDPETREITSSERITPFYRPEGS